MTPLSLLRKGRGNGPPPILAALVLAMLDFLTTVDETKAAAVSECLSAEFTGSRPTLEFPTWSSFRQWSLPPVISQQDGRKGFSASSACVPTPTLSAGLIARAGTRDQAISMIDAAVGQGSRADTTANRASTTGSRTMKTKSRTPTVKISIPPYNGKKHALRTRTTPIEIQAETGERPSVIIGPKDQHSTSHTTAVNVLPPAPLTQSGRRPIDLSNPLRTVLPQAGYDDESNRMNSTTSLALHGGECAYGCP